MPESAIRVRLTRGCTTRSDPFMPGTRPQSSLPSGVAYRLEPPHEDLSRLANEGDGGHGIRPHVDLADPKARGVQRGAEPLADALQRRLVPDPGAQELQIALILRQPAQPLRLFLAEHTGRRPQRVPHLPLEQLDVHSDGVVEGEREQPGAPRVGEVELERAPAGERRLSVGTGGELDRGRVALEISPEELP